MGKNDRLKKVKGPDLLRRRSSLTKAPAFQRTLPKSERAEIAAIQKAVAGVMPSGANFAGVGDVGHLR
jgi:hypothetical protein